MDLILKMLFVIAVAVFGLVQNMNLSTHARASKYLKEDLEVAVHDAALNIDKVKLANGEFVFEKSIAEETFKRSFNLNTGLDLDEYKILEFKVLDQSNTTFPVNYKATSVKFEDTFTAPTIIAVIESKVSNTFFNASEKPVRRVASYTYKINLDKLNQPSIDVIDNLIANENGLYWVVPYTKNITSPFGYRIHPITGVSKLHKGIDVASAGILNKAVVSAREGKVSFAGMVNGYGNIVIVDHGAGFETRYAHLNSINVTNNQKVLGGQILGLVGSTGASTGPHLHFETRVDGEAIDPKRFYGN